MVSCCWFGSVHLHSSRTTLYAHTTLLRCCCYWPLTINTIVIIPLILGLYVSRCLRCSRCCVTLLPRCVGCGWFGSPFTVLYGYTGLPFPLRFTVTFTFPVYGLFTLRYARIFQLLMRLPVLLPLLRLLRHHVAFTHTYIYFAFTHDSPVVDSIWFICVFDTLHTHVAFVTFGWLHLYFTILLFRILFVISLLFISHTRFVITPVPFVGYVCPLYSHFIPTVGYTLLRYSSRWFHTVYYSSTHFVTLLPRSPVHTLGWLFVTGSVTFGYVTGYHPVVTFVIPTLRSHTHTCCVCLHYILRWVGLFFYSQLVSHGWVTLLLYVVYVPIYYVWFQLYVPRCVTCTVVGYGYRLVGCDTLFLPHFVYVVVCCRCVTPFATLRLRLPPHVRCLFYICYWLLLLGWFCSSLRLRYLHVVTYTLPHTVPGSFYISFFYVCWFCVTVLHLPVIIIIGWLFRLVRWVTYTFAGSTRFTVVIYTVYHTLLPLLLRLRLRFSRSDFGWLPLDYRLADYVVPGCCSLLDLLITTFIYVTFALLHVYCYSRSRIWLLLLLIWLRWLFIYLFYFTHYFAYFGSPFVALTDVTVLHLRTFTLFLLLHFTVHGSTYHCWRHSSHFAVAYTYNFTYAVLPLHTVRCALFPFATVGSFTVTFPRFDFALFARLLLLLLLFVKFTFLRIYTPLHFLRLDSVWFTLWLCSLYTFTHFIWLVYYRFCLPHICLYTLFTVGYFAVRSTVVVTHLVSTFILHICTYIYSCCWIRILVAICCYLHVTHFAIHLLCHFVVTFAVCWWILVVFCCCYCWFLRLRCTFAFARDWLFPRCSQLLFIPSRLLIHTFIDWVPFTFTAVPFSTFCSICGLFVRLFLRFTTLVVRLRSHSSRYTRFAVGTVTRLHIVPHYIYLQLWFDLPDYTTHCYILCLLLLVGYVRVYVYYAVGCGCYSYCCTHYYTGWLGWFTGAVLLLLHCCICYLLFCVCVCTVAFTFHCYTQLPHCCCCYIFVIIITFIHYSVIPYYGLRCLIIITFYTVGLVTFTFPIITYGYTFVAHTTFTTITVLYTGSHYTHVTPHCAFRYIHCLVRLHLPRYTRCVRYFIVIARCLYRYTTPDAPHTRTRCRTVRFVWFHTFGWSRPHRSWLPSVGCCCTVYHVRSRGCDLRLPLVITQCVWLRSLFVLRIRCLPAVCWITPFYHSLVPRLFRSTVTFYVAVPLHIFVVFYRLLLPVLFVGFTFVHHPFILHLLHYYYCVILLMWHCSIVIIIVGGVVVDYILHLRYIYILGCTFPFGSHVAFSSVSSRFTRYGWLRYHRIYVVVYVCAHTTCTHFHTHFV